jgi:hypothetical protein
MNDLTTASAPDDDDHPHEGQNESPPEKPQRGKATRDRGKIKSTEDCLTELSQLPSLAALGILKPQVVGVMRSTYDVILRHHQQADLDGPKHGLADHDLLKILREQPEALRWLAPFLSDEQIELIRDAEDNDDDS